MSLRVNAHDVIVEQNLARGANQEPQIRTREQVEAAKKQKPPIFMEPMDVSTVNEQGAEQIGEFLSNKKVRNERKELLTDFLLEQKDEFGEELYTEKKAKKLAGEQVKNEQDQARAKITIPFVDEEAYEKFKEQLKAEGKEDLYRPQLIKDKKLLAYINGDKIQNIDKKEAHLKKFFMTDAEGKLIEGENGQYVFDPEKYKSEWVKDTDGYRLTLSGRAQHAEERDISKGTEKKAVKAAGLGSKTDHTWLYRSLLIGAGVSSIVFGGAAATAIAAASSTAGAVVGGTSADANASSVAKASAHNHVGQIVGGAVPLIGAAFVKDRDPEIDRRKEAQEVFENIPEPKKTEPEIKQEEKTEENPVVETQCEEAPCMQPKQLPPEVTQISIIRGGGPYHYAQLYVDENDKPLQIGTKNFKELQRKLTKGDDAIQTVDKKRELKNEITLADGTKVKLAADAEDKAKKGFSDARIQKGTGDRKYARVQRNGKWVIVFCENGKQVPNTGSYNSEQEADKLIRLITTPAK